MASKNIFGNINSIHQMITRGKDNYAHLFKSVSISASRCVGVIPKEKSEDDTAFEKQSILFALAVKGSMTLSLGKLIMNRDRARQRDIEFRSILFQVIDSEH
uniref:Uncharacterized protein n=1 Tax=Cucumis melo TaxID=3656 RepID=A0A9I9E4M6_CUCME